MMNNHQKEVTHIHKCIRTGKRQNRVATGHEIVNRTMFPSFHKCVDPYKFTPLYLPL